MEVNTNYNYSLYMVTKIYDKSKISSQWYDIWSQELNVKKWLVLQL